MGSNLTRIRVAALHPATPPLAHARLAKRATDLEHRTCPVVTGTDGASPAGRGAKRNCRFRRHRLGIPLKDEEV